MKGVILTECEVAGRPEKWEVRWPSPVPGKPRKRKRFKTKSEAAGFHRLKEIEVRNHGRAAASLTATEALDSRWAIDSLAKHGKTLREIVGDYLDRVSSPTLSTDTGDATLAFIDHVRSMGRSTRYIGDLKTRLGRLGERFAGRPVGEIGFGDFGEWLSATAKHPVTRNNYRRCCSAFFAWCMKMKFASENVAEQTDVATTITEIGILTPEELRTILATAPADTRAFYCIAAFAGLRTSEITGTQDARRLRWEDVDFKRGRIDVNPRAKTGKRHVPITDNLREWLLPLAGAGEICPGAIHRRLGRHRRAMEADGFRWVQNGLRHSYGSYCVALHEDIAKVSLWMGNTPTVLVQNYRDVVGKEVAEEWFSIVPG